MYISKNYMPLKGYVIKGWLISRNFDWTNLKLKFGENAIQSFPKPCLRLVSRNSSTVLQARNSSWNKIPRRKKPKEYGVRGLLNNFLVELAKSIYVNTIWSIFDVVQILFFGEQCIYIKRYIRYRQQEVFTFYIPLRLLISGFNEPLWNNFKINK